MFQALGRLHLQPYLQITQPLQLSVKYQMKNYSFSNIAAEESLTRNSADLSAHYRHSQLRAQQANQRIQEIKKKYDTPSRRQRIDSLKKSQDFQINSKQSLESQENAFASRDRHPQEAYSHQPVPTFGTNHLKESFALNRLQKSTLKNDESCRQLQNLRKDYKGEQRRISSYCREDEQVIFSKVREMKESLVNKDFMRGSMNPRSSISSLKPQNQKSRCLDPRVQNIDKINSKIKQILSCLAENDKYPSKFLKDNPKESLPRENIEDVLLDVRKSYIGEEVKRSTLFESARKSQVGPPASFHSYKQQKPQQSKEYQPTYNKVKTQSPNLNQHQNSNDLYRRQSIPMKPTEIPINRNADSQEYPLRQSVSANKFQPDFSRTPHHFSKYTDSRTPLQASRSRSQIASVHSVKDDTLKSGKKVNDQIKKFQSKIEAMEREKKMLNIDFTPFSTKNRSTSALLTGTYLQATSVESEKEKTQNSGRKPHIPHFRSSSSTKDHTFSSHFKQHRFLQSRDAVESNQTDISKHRERSQKDNEQTQSQRRQLSLYQVDVDIKTVRINKEEVFKEEDKDNRMRSDCLDNFEEVRKRADEGILQRRNKLQYPHDELIKSDGLNKLVSLFCEQAKLDQQFRNMKIWLEETSDNSKFQRLSTLLKEKGIQLSSEECTATFHIDESEHNPFFSLQGFQGSFEGVVAAYLEATQHWTSKIKKQFDRESLLAEGFTQSKMDLQRKGFVQLQDLVRLLNIQSGTFYRNRDIFLIFKRLTGKERSSFEEVLSQLCP